jgi:hypothetical protein
LTKRLNYDNVESASQPEKVTQQTVGGDTENLVIRSVLTGWLKSKEGGKNAGGI